MPVDHIKAEAATPAATETSALPQPPAPGELEPVTLRRATPADAPALALVGAATFLEAFTWMLPGPDIIAFTAAKHTPAAYAEYLAHPDTRITLATTGDDVPVGYVMLATPELPSLETFPTDIELKRIYLFSRFRSAPVTTSGVPNTPTSDKPATPGGTPTSDSSATAVTPTNVRASQALMDAAIADARALHRTRLLLGTHASNLRAIAFYRRNGFTEAGFRTFQVGTQTCSDLIFAKHL